MLLGFPSFEELKLHPLCVDDDGNRISKKTHKDSADSLIFGALKLNNEIQYGMGAEVFRLWVASVDLELPMSNTILCEERFIGKKC